MEKYRDFRPTAMDPAGAFIYDDRSDWLVAPVSQTRDSGTLDRSNYRAAVRMLSETATSDPDGESDWEEHRFGHWGPGWFEIIIVKPGTEAARVAEDIEACLANYPILSDDDHSNLECEEASLTWQNNGLRYRIEACARFNVSIFAARRDEIPDDPSGELVYYLADGC